MYSEPPPRKLLDRVREQDQDLDAVRANRLHYLPIVLTVEETLEILKNLTDVYQIVAKKIS